MKKYIKIISLIFIFAITVCAESFAGQTEKWNSVEGLKRLESSHYKNDFYQLANYYQPQINPVYCAVATGTMLLNAIHGDDEIPSQKESQIQRPESLGGGVIEFHSYSQLSFLNDKTDKIKRSEIITYEDPKEIKGDKEIYDAGISLSDFAKMLATSYDLKVIVKYARKNDAKEINNFRSDLKKYLFDDKKFIAANFDGKIFGNKTGGHISPLAAYDEESDSILVLDVALHKNTWYWVGVEDFYKAMNSKDGDFYRGYLVVSK